MVAHVSFADRKQHLEVLTIPALDDNYIYAMVWDKSAAVIDPADANAVLKVLRQRACKLTRIFVTHHHDDHVAGIAEIKKATGCKVLGPDEPRIPGLDESLTDGEVTEAGPFSLQVLSTPGHCHTHVAYYDARLGLLWTGDTLFTAGCGRLFDCPPDLMWGSLQKLAALPDETKVFCGHEYTLGNLRFAVYLEPGNADVVARLESAVRARSEKMPTVPSTIGLEKKTNPFLRTRSPEIRALLNMKDATDLAVFTELRRRKDLFQ